MRARAFSLVELLVAMALLGVLLAGMAQVLLGSLRGFNEVREGLAAQRTLRWAVAGLEPDLRMIGLRFPPAALRPLPDWAEPGCWILPDQPLGRIRARAWEPLQPGDDPLEPPGRTSDVLVWVQDRPLPATATLATALTGPAPGAQAAVSLCLDRDLTLDAGDLLGLEGERFECARVLEPVDLVAAVPGLVTVGAVLDGPAWARSHPLGAQVALVRPLRAVTLAVVYRSLPGAHGPVPCLVRAETACQGDPDLAHWQDRVATAQILAENVTGLRVDLSRDGQWPGLRAMGPLGFQPGPALLSLELEARSPGPPVRHDRLRWTFRPRNFGLERR